MGGGGGKGGGSTTVGYRYYMTLQIALGRGPIDQVVHIKVGDKSAWPFIEGSGGNYDSVITDDRSTSIQAPNLFGGDKSEGGVEGSLTCMMGHPWQIYPGWMKSLLGGLVPDFRGTATLIYDGLVSTLNPYPKTWWIRVRRILRGWDGAVWQPSLATIYLVTESTFGDATDRNIWAMNPAHILYECVTNRSWGRGYSRSRINEASWLAAAQTLYNEGFGLCIAWKREGTLDEFIGEVIRHIGATMYVSRETGLLELRLIRGDYDPNSIPLFTYNTGLLEVDTPETATLADAIGEVIVTYHNPTTNEDMQVRAQNLAVIQSGEGVNTQKVNYPGLPTGSLAARVAQRDLKAQSVEQSRYKVKLDRRAWKLYPGAVFRISAADKGISNLVLRAGKLSESDIISGEIECEAVIDVFGLPATAFSPPEEGGYVPPSKTPEVVSNRLVREATYVDVFRRTSVADRAYIEVTDTAIATVGSRSNSLMLGYEIWSKTALESYVNRGTETFAPTALVNGAIGPYATTILIDNGFDLGLVNDGATIQINDEIMIVEDVTLATGNTSGTLTVKRGVYDTIPAAHANNSRIFFLDESLGNDFREYVIGETVNVKLLSTTSDGRLDIALAPEDTVNLVGRQGRPYPPGDVRVDATPCFNEPTVGEEFIIEWAHRDRITQQDIAIAHSEPSVGPEAGVTYNVRFYDDLDALLEEFTGITDNFAIFDDTFEPEGDLRVELESERGGYKSLYKYSFTLTRTL